MYVVPRRKINDGPSIAEPPFKRFDVTVYPILPPRPNHGCSAVFVAVPIVKFVVADAALPPPRAPTASLLALAAVFVHSKEPPLAFGATPCALLRQHHGGGYRLGLSLGGPRAERSALLLPLGLPFVSIGRYIGLSPLPLGPR